MLPVTSAPAPSISVVSRTRPVPAAVCTGSPVRFSSTPIRFPSSELRTYRSTPLSAATSLTAPAWSAPCCRRSASSRRVRASTDFVSALCAATLSAAKSRTSGSHGVPVVKPAPADPSHTIGERSGSRPMPMPGCRSSAGSRTWSAPISAFGIPSSSP